jgi:hypothetical protein
MLLVLQRPLKSLQRVIKALLMQQKFHRNRNCLKCLRRSQLPTLLFCCQLRIIELLSRSVTQRLQQQLLPS